MRPSDTGEQPDRFVEYGWLSAQPVIQAAAKVSGAITRSKFLAALNKTTVTFGKGSQALLPPLDFAKPNPDRKYSRLFNTKLILQKWNVAKKVFVAVPGVAPVYGDKLHSVVAMPSGRARGRAVFCGPAPCSGRARVT